MLMANGYQLLYWSGVDQIISNTYNTVMKNIKSLLLFIILPLIVFSQTNPHKINPKNFSFIVLGDRTGEANQPVFEQIIETVRRIKPDFIINVGDLIQGYTKDQNVIHQEWDSIFSVFGNLNDKFYFTPGNHDITDSESKAIFLERVGYQKTYFAFSIGKNHFIVLDNSLQEKANQPDSFQISWLESTLKQYKKNDKVFCFMHRSFWKDAYTNNKPDTLHKLFVKYGVDYVFSGHDHFYFRLIWDGVTYTQIGPSGSRLKIYNQEEFGAFQNFLLVNVKKDKTRLKLVRPDGSYLPADYVTFDDITELKKINHAISVTPFQIESDKKITVNIENISTQPIISDLSWYTENTSFQITPIMQTVYIEQAGNATYEFYCTVKDKNIYPLPRIKMVYPYAQGKKNYNFERILPIELQANCLKISKPIKIDGRLSELAYTASQPLDVFGTNNGEASQTDPTQIWFFYDKDNFYISGRFYDYEPNQIMTTITERDKRVYEDDHINIVLQPNPTSDTYYQFFINAKGIVMDRLCQMQGEYSKRDVNWNSNIITHAKINASAWTLETAIPLKNFPDFNPDDWGFNLVRFQSSKNMVSTYSVPFEHNPKTFAKLRFTK